MPNHDTVVMGASAGGVDAIRQIVAGLPPDLPAAILVVVHISPEHPSRLPEILARAGPLPAHAALDGESIQPGHIYVAPPDYHLLVDRGRVRLRRGPKENRHRPAVDPLFRTAANAYGPRVIGVVLSGVLDDGTSGLIAIKARGGIAIVQDPDDAAYGEMPRRALESANVDHVLPLSKIAQTLVQLVNQTGPDQGDESMADEIEFESEIAELNPAAVESEERPGHPSVYGCPDCGGILWELDEGRLVHFRCRVGHAYTEENLVSVQAEGIEDALWSAMRALEEHAQLSHAVARRSREHGHTASAGRFEERAEDAHERAAKIRRLLLSSLPEPSVSEVR